MNLATSLGLVVGNISFLTLTILLMKTNLILPGIIEAIEGLPFEYHRQGNTANTCKHGHLHLYILCKSLDHKTTLGLDSNEQLAKGDGVN